MPGPYSQEFREDVVTVARRRGSGVRTQFTSSQVISSTVPDRVGQLPAVATVGVHRELAHPQRAAALGTLIDPPHRTPSHSFDLRYLRLQASGDRYRFDVLKERGSE